MSKFKVFVNEKNERTNDQIEIERSLRNDDDLHSIYVNSEL